MRDIVDEVAAATKVPVHIILGKLRGGAMGTQARQLAMWRCRNEGQRSLTEIGEFFGRDHTTVLHACRRIEAMPPEKRVPTANPKEAALRANRKTYLGLPCVNGHPGYRYASNNNCITCVKNAKDRHRRAVKAQQCEAIDG